MADSTHVAVFVVVCRQVRTVAAANATKVVELMQVDAVLGKVRTTTEEQTSTAFALGVVDGAAVHVDGAAAVQLVLSLVLCCCCSKWLLWKILVVDTFFLSMDPERKGLRDQPCTKQVF